MRADVADHDVLRPEGPTQVGDGLLRLDRPAVVVLEGAELGEEGGPQVLVDERLAGRVSLARVPSTDAERQHRGQQPAQRPIDVADELDLRLVERVDLGRLGVDVDDPLAPVGVPARRCVLDEVVADRHHEVGAIEARQDVVACL